jgi:hypothetical protein
VKDILVNPANWTNILALISIVIAVLAALFTFFQWRVARKSYKLQRAAFNDSKISISLQNIDECFIHNDKNADDLHYFFYLNIVNLSDRPTSINLVKLILHLDNGKEYYITASENNKLYPDNKRLILPANISPRSSIVGWTAFSINKKIYNELQIESHTILVSDIHKLIAKQEIIYIHEEVIGYDI